MNTKQKISLVQIYIYFMKDKEVNIKIESARDLYLLDRAYDIASTWVNNNNVRITHC